MNTVMLRSAFQFASANVCRDVLRQSVSLPSTSAISQRCNVLARYFSSTGMPAEKIDEILKSDKVVVFMKGVPAEPMCGFSNAVVQVLRMHGVPYASVNVLDNEDVRQGIKDYSDWPTIPQVYVNGEFIGGCDILIQMHRNGDLIEELKKAGIRSKLLDEENKKENDSEKR